MDYVNRTRFDVAYDFAENYQSVIPFCAKMLRVFAVQGSLTERQIEALLRIRAERGAY